MARPWRAAMSAASLTRFARSAPEKPGVPRAIDRRSTSGSSATFRECTCRICSRPLMSGLPTVTWRSKRPGRSSAWSRMSARLVAATMMMLSDCEKPSISTSSWFSVCSRSSWLSELPPRLRPTASSSSMKMMQVLWRRASRNSLRTRDAPTPAYISTKSEPLAEMNGTPASPAIERASSVLPVPGGPTSRMPRGIRPPIDANRSGSFRKSTISRTSSFASSTPATSLNVTVTCWGSMVRAFSSVGTRPVIILNSASPARPKNSSASCQRPVAAGVRRLDAADVEDDAAIGEAGDERRVGGDIPLRRDRGESLPVLVLEFQ